MSESIVPPFEADKRAGASDDPAAGAAARCRLDAATPADISRTRPLAFAEGSLAGTLLKVCQQGDQPKDQPKDKPKDDPEALKKEAAERARLLLSDSANGEWSKRSQETWRKLYEDMSKVPGATPESVAAAMNKVGARVNEELERRGSEFRVGIAMTEEDGKSTVYMQLNGPGIDKGENLNSILDGKDTPTSVRAGSMSPKMKPVTDPV